MSWCIYRPRLPRKMTNTGVTACPKARGGALNRHHPFSLFLCHLLNESAGSPIDWSNEANEVAKATSGGSARPLDGRRQSEPNQPSKSIFGETPAYHADEQFKTDDGQWIVFVSYYCHQIASPFASLNVGNGLGVQTYCVGKANTPRGDLFDQLPAYQKIHHHQASRNDNWGRSPKLVASNPAEWRVWRGSADSRRPHVDARRDRITAAKQTFLVARIM